MCYPFAVTYLLFTLFSFFMYSHFTLVNFLFCLLLVWLADDNVQNTYRPKNSCRSSLILHKRHKFYSILFVLHFNPYENILLNKQKHNILYGIFHDRCGKLSLFLSSFFHTSNVGTSLRGHLLKTSIGGVEEEYFKKNIALFCKNYRYFRLFWDRSQITCETFWGEQR